MEKDTPKDVRDAILLHLDKIERTLAWLSDKTEIPYPTLYSVFKQRTFVLSDKNLGKINKVLETDFIND
jgi:predicted transcriptional regulator